MKLAINLALSLIMLALSLWLVWPNEVSREVLRAALSELTVTGFAPTLALYLGLLCLVHFCRAYRWNNLLAPLGVRLGLGRLMAVSSVGFMAILVVPARLGELVRPALIRKKGHISASAALGTVAVERIIDGLVVSVAVFATFIALRGPDSPGWMMPTAYVAFGLFTVCLIGLVFALTWPAWTVSTFLRLTLLTTLAPRLAARLDGKLHELIRGFAVLRDRKNLAAFLAWTLVYWIANGLSCWVLARGLGVNLSVTGAFAMMGLVAVGITLPNSPGMIGQYQWLTALGCSLELGRAAITDGTVLFGEVLAFAVILHGMQVVWYVGTGLLAVATPHVSFSELWAARKLDPEPAASDAPAS
ncbi:MAG: flippase-like domain-containing protein [Kofleriaceae bacterium]|nr:flippase-like domain-containing protein [Kofleriaceae bacterium]MCL4226174.1 flippase-like domain-containing protein [Myxococcales bacterium]